MYVIIWEYRVKAEHQAEFEEIYSPGGAWVQLFKQATGYLGTELLQDPNDSDRYITIDRWKSLPHYETFLVQWKAEYAALDTQCEDLTKRETLLGGWESLSR